MEYNIFEMAIRCDKNSWEFDLEILKELKGLSDIPINKFDTIVRKIMKKKSSCKLWIDHRNIREWDGKEYREVNYRCCPASHKARYYFCLILDRNDNKINVSDGFLRAV